MYMTGFADEAADAIEGQIKVTKELGWENIESRRVGSANIHDIPDDEFERTVEKLEEAGVKVNCFGSTIANWGKQITDSMDQTHEEIDRAIPRMKRLDTKLIRVMSFAVLKDRGPDDQMKEERFERMRTIVKRFTDEGLLPVHENCMNYGGMGYTYTLELIENVPGLKLVFDTGNPVFTDDRSKDKPYPKQSSWEFYSHVKDHIAYVHIKDGVWEYDEEAAKHKTRFTYPGEGDGDVVKITNDLVASGYDGGISIEPHLGAVFHDPSIKSDEEKRYAMYLEYGKRMEKIVRDAGGKL
ncbi:MAG: sugar phosphate isomerase/epimerase family protein [Candidatus Sumerlaeota bacterium]